MYAEHLNRLMVLMVRIWRVVEKPKLQTTGFKGEPYSELKAYLVACEPVSVSGRDTGTLMCSLALLFNAGT